MSDHDMMMERITKVQAAHADELMKKANVIGVAAGMRKRDGEYTNDMVLVVMVEKKVTWEQLAPEDRIPPEIDGVPVDVQEMGIFTAQ